MPSNALLIPSIAGSEILGSLILGLPLALPGLLLTLRLPLTGLLLASLERDLDRLKLRAVALRSDS